MEKRLKLGLLTLIVAVASFGWGYFFRDIFAHNKTKAYAAPVRHTVSLPDFSGIAEDVNPAVVTIESTMIFEHPYINPFANDDFFRFFFGPGYQSQPKKQKQVSWGSGFIISSDGYIITNNHVIDKAKKIVITLKDGRKFDAKVIGTDPEIDIALLKIDAKNLKYVPLGNSDKVKVGEWVVAIGNPLMYDHTVTAGIISAKGRKLGSGLESFLQTDAAINFGNSGGPLVNMKGEVIGVNTAISAQGQNIGFAVPINMVKEIIPDLKKYGKVERGALGVTVSKLSDTDKKAFGVDHGALVQSVQPGMAADRAGIKPYDIIVKVDGKEIKTNDDLVKIISSRKPNEKVKITVIRNGREKTLTVVLDSRNDFTSPSSPKNEKQRETTPKSIKDKLGFSIMDITPRVKYRLRIPDDVNGVVITDIDSMSEAYDKFLRDGAVITELNRKPVLNASQFVREISKMKKGDIIILKVYQDGAFRILSLEIK